VAQIPSGQPLASAGLKMVRADEHLEVLIREVRRFKESKPYRVIHEIDPQTGERLIHAVPLRDPDPELSLVLGDLVHNLSAALDHAVFGLSVYEAGRPLNRPEMESIGFPISVDELAFAKAASTKLRFLDDGPRSVIEAAQPFHHASKAASLNHPLAVLHEMWNADKHRTLLLVTGQPELFGIGMNTEVAEGVHRFTGPRAEFGTLVSRLALDAGQEDTREPYFEVKVLLPPNGPVRSPIAAVSSLESLATSMSRTVRSVLEHLQTYVIGVR
jgi:hypothetical protein